MVFGTRLDLARPDSDRGNAIAALAHRAFGAAEWRVAGIGVNILPGAIISRVENQRILVHAGFAQLVHDPADAGVEFEIESAYLDLDIDLCSNSGAGMLG